VIPVAFKNEFATLATGELVTFSTWRQEKRRATRIGTRHRFAVNARVITIAFECLRLHALSCAPQQVV
jgi:hypothetical protein